MEPTPSPSPFSSNPAAQPRPGWWSRNWKWFVPTGCLSIIVLGFACAAALVVFVFGALKSSDVYKTAVARAESDAAVTSALGSPIKEGWFMSGKTNVTGSTGEADIAIPISGPKGAGTIYAVATKSAGRWTYTTLEVEVKGSGPRIDLLHTENAEP
ncbi:MAG: cytochrome c oxidase assembly factor 1 family protein [Verrucomicrobiota bacterium]|nr:cytochrome c oxidase assembly factor 1 family protein [Verrucomicrobiota bacterium]